MLIQDNDCYKLEVVLQWLDASQLHLKVRTHNLEKNGWEVRTQNFFIEPEGLSKIADYINDTLCR